MDYIHDVAFDVYGRRMATCSGDRFVRIFELSDNGQWHIIAEWQAHKGSVTHLSWAHPEFGSLLATCGSDHDAKLWEEYSPTATGISSGSGNNNNNNNNNTTMTGGGVDASSSSSNNPLSRWSCATSLTEARRAVNCVQFAPRQFGLRIATGSADGNVRIYEAVDVMNLAQWPLQATLSVVTSSDPTTAAASATAAGLGEGVTCLSWSTGRFEPPTLVVGTGGMAPSSSSATAGSSSTTNAMMMMKTNSTASATTTTSANNNNNNNASGHSSFLSVCVIYRYSESARHWQAILQLPVSGKRVLDVAWAPNVGRRFHYIATAEDDQLRIFKLSRYGTTGASAPPPPTGSGSGSITSNNTSNNNPGTTGSTAPNAPLDPSANLQVESIQTLDSNAKVVVSGNNNNNNNNNMAAPSWTTFWRCQWNVTGTVLSSSGDGGVVQLWKADWQGKFKCVSYVQGDVATTSSSSTWNGTSTPASQATAAATVAFE
jgi:WD40 repeat protein